MASFEARTGVVVQVQLLLQERERVNGRGILIRVPYASVGQPLVSSPYPLSKQPSQRQKHRGARSRSSAKFQNPERRPTIHSFGYTAHVGLLQAFDCTLLSIVAIENFVVWD